MRDWLATGTAATLIVVGVGAIIAPRQSAAVYGTPLGQDDKVVFVRAAGIRDAIIGGLLFNLSDKARRRDFSMACTWLALIALADALSVFSERGFAAKRNLVLHLSGAAGLFLLQWRGSFYD